MINYNMFDTILLRSYYLYFYPSTDNGSSLVEKCQTDSAAVSSNSDAGNQGNINAIEELL